MAKPTVRWKYARIAYIVPIIVWIIYTILLFVGPNQNPYKWGLTEINLIRVSFTLPILVIWLVAVRAVIRFKKYAVLIDGSPEADGFRRIADGLAWLLAYLISLLVLGRIPLLFHSHNPLYVAVFIKNHLPVYILLVSSVMLYLGSMKLLASHKAPTPASRTTIAWVLYLIFAGCFATFFALNPPAAQSISSNQPAFAVSAGVLMFSLVLPSLVAWGLAVIASVNMAAYAGVVKGVIYRRSLNRLVGGIYASTAFAILVEILVLDASHLRNIGSTAILLILYGIIVAYGIGAALIARSARHLTLIEVAP